MRLANFAMRNSIASPEPLAVTGFTSQYYLTSGENPERVGNGSMQAAPVGAYKTKTGMIRLLCVTDRMFRRLCEEVLERPELLADPSFATNPARVEHRTALQEVLDAAFSTDTREHWMAKIHAAGVTAGAVNLMSEALESQDAKARELVRSVPHPTAGTVRVVASPFQHAR